MARITKATARPSRTRPGSKDSKSISTRTPQRRKSSTIFPNAIPTPDDSGRRGSVFDGRNFRVFNPESPLTPVGHGSRRFSDAYGHGHVLDDTAIPIRFTTGTKRRQSNASEQFSPKRVRFDDIHETIPKEEEDSEHTFTDGGYDLHELPMEDLSLARQDLGLTSEFAKHPDLHLLTALRDVTEPLSISQISSLLQLIQKLTGHFAARYFADAVDDTEATVAMDMRNFPLENLKLKYPSLYLTAINVLDASTNDTLDDEYMLKNPGWHKFFAHPNYRPFLVSAILGEWFTQRIFKDPAFGLSAAGRKEIEDGVDKQYLFFDSFIRAKRRSIVVEKHRKTINADNWLRKAAHELADELMIVFGPMLPFAEQLDMKLTQEDMDLTAEIKDALAELIIHCAVVNLAIVRTGENGTIVRPAHRLEKGKRCYVTAPMELCNYNLLCSRAEDTEESADKEIIVKMTCWPRMEGWVPHGLDLEDTSILERNHKLANLPFHLQAKIHRGEPLTPKEIKEIQSNFCWDCSGLKKNWDVLPGELHRVAEQQKQKRETLQRMYEARSKAERRRLRQAGEDNDNYPSDSSSDAEEEECNDNLEKNEEPPRGSWVTEYSCLAKHQVYCEWTKPDSFYTQAIAANGMNAETSIRQVNSLENAIKEAREILPLPTYLKAQTEDLVYKLWSFYASHNLAIEWSTFLIATLVYLSRGRVIGNVSDIVALPVKLIGAILNHIDGSSGLKAVSEGISGLSNPRFTRTSAPENVLNSANSYVDNNLSIFKTAIHNVLASLKGLLDSAQVNAASRVSAGVSTVTNFVGQRQPFTTNPIVLSGASKATTMSASTTTRVHTFPNPFDHMSSLVKEKSVTLGPTAATLTSTAAAVAAQITKPISMAPADSVVASLISPIAEVVTDNTIIEKAQTVATSVAKIVDDELVLGEPETILPVTTPTTVVSTTSESIIAHATAAQTATENSIVTGRSGIWRDTASKVGNKIGEYLQGSGRGLTKTRTATIKPGERYMTVVGGGQLLN